MRSQQIKILDKLKEYIRTHYDEASTDPNMALGNLNNGLCQGLSLLWNLVDQNTFDSFIQTIMSWQPPKESPELEEIYNYINLLHPSPAKAAESWRQDPQNTERLHLLTGKNYQELFEFSSFFDTSKVLGEFLDMSIKAHFLHMIAVPGHALGLKFDGQTYSLYDSNDNDIHHFINTQDLANHLFQLSQSKQNEPSLNAKDSPALIGIQVLKTESMNHPSPFPTDQQLLNWCPQSKFEVYRQHHILLSTNNTSPHQILKTIARYSNENIEALLTGAIIELGLQGLDVTDLLNAHTEKQFSKRRIFDYMKNNITPEPDDINSGGYFQSSKHNIHSAHCARLGKQLSGKHGWQALSKHDKKDLLFSTTSDDITLLSYLDSYTNLLQLSKKGFFTQGPMNRYQAILEKLWKSPIHDLSLDEKKQLISLCSYNMKRSMILKIIDSQDKFPPHAFHLFFNQYAENASGPQIKQLFEKTTTESQRIELLETIMPCFNPQKLDPKFLKSFLPKNTREVLLKTPEKLPKTWQVLSNNSQLAGAVLSPIPRIQEKDLTHYPDTFIDQIIKAHPNNYDFNTLPQILGDGCKWLSLNSLLTAHQDRSMAFSFAESMLIDICKKGRAIEQWPQIEARAVTYLQNKTFTKTTTLLAILSNTTSPKLRDAWKSRYQSQERTTELLDAIVGAFTTAPSLMKSSMPFFVNNVEENPFFKELLGACDEPKTKREFLYALLRGRPLLDSCDHRFVTRELNTIPLPAKTPRPTMNQQPNTTRPIGQCDISPAGNDTSDGIMPRRIKRK